MTLGEAGRPCKDGILVRSFKDDMRDLVFRLARANYSSEHIFVAIVGLRAGWRAYGACSSGEEYLSTIITPPGGKERLGANRGGANSRARRLARRREAREKASAEQAALLVVAEQAALKKTSEQFALKPAAEKAAFKATLVQGSLESALQSVANKAPTQQDTLKANTASAKGSLDSATEQVVSKVVPGHARELNDWEAERAELKFAIDRAARVRFSMGEFYARKHEQDVARRAEALKERMLNFMRGLGYADTFRYSEIQSFPPEWLLKIDQDYVAGHLH